MLFDCVFLSLQVAHRSVFHGGRAIKTAVGWRIWGKSMFTALRFENNNHVPAVRTDSSSSDTERRLLLKLQPTENIRVLQTARFPILQIIFVL